MFGLEVCTKKKVIYHQNAEWNLIIEKADKFLKMLQVVH